MTIFRVAGVFPLYENQWKLFWARSLHTALQHPVQKNHFDGDIAMAATTVLHGSAAIHYWQTIHTFILKPKQYQKTRDPLFQEVQHP